MTIPSAVNKSGPYFYNGATTSFAYGFKISDQTHIRVVETVTATGVETDLVLSTDYTVTGVGNDTGTVVISPARAAGKTVVLVRSVPFTQLLDLQNQGAYFAERVEAAFDAGVARDQQLQEQIDRAVRVPVSSDTDPDDLIADLEAASLAAVNAAAATAADVMQTAADRVQTGLDAAAAASSVNAVTLAALKALDTATITSAYVGDTTRAGRFLWRTGNYTGLADDQDIVKANAIDIDDGAWVRSQPVITKRNTSLPFNNWVGTGGYNLDWGIKIGGVQTFAPRNGTDDDSEVFNAILAQEPAVVLTPGIINVKSAGLVAEIPSTKIVALGGLQSTHIQRSLDLPAGQHTLRMGHPTDTNKGARGAVLEDLWFTHPGRLLSSYVSLPNKLTNEEAHVAIYGGQGDRYRIGGYGAVAVMIFYGGSGHLVEHPFFMGGLWHPDNAALQEARAHIWSRYSSTWGQGTNLHIQKPEIYGAIQPGLYTRTIGTQSYDQPSGVRCGPQFNLLIESCEDWSVEGGFMGLAGFANIGIVPAASSNLIFNGKVRGTYLDESHEYGIYALNNAADQNACSQLTLDDVTFNGQFQCRSAVNFRGDGAGGYSVRRLKMNDCRLTAYAAGGLILGGVDTGEITGLRASGYNQANNDTSAGGSALDTSGVVIFGITQHVQVEHCRYGGGPNSEAEANNCQWGLYDSTAAGAGNRYFRQREVVSGGLGKAGGGLAYGTADSAA